MRLGQVELGRTELVEFATRYDPLPIHTDAATSPFGEVIASGVHTMALFSSLASRAFIPRLALLAGKGIDMLRLPHPVRPDSMLTGWVRLERIELRESRADVVYQATLTDQLGHVVLSFTGITVVSRRDIGAATVPC